MLHREEAQNVSWTNYAVSGWIELLLSSDEQRLPGSGKAIDSSTNFRQNLAKTWLAPSLLEAIEGGSPGTTFRVIIEVNSAFPGGAIAARWVLVQSYRKNHSAEAEVIFAEPALSVPPDLEQRWTNAPRFADEDRIDLRKSGFTEVYLFAAIKADTIFGVLQEAGTQIDGKRVPSPIHKIWDDHEVVPFVYRSARTIKCDAARIAFSTDGAGIVWAVADTGIDATHPHFQLHQNLVLPDTLQHHDFTQSGLDPMASASLAQIDPLGHGTHVAGIIAGQTMVDGITGAVHKVTGVTRILVNRKIRRGLDDPRIDQVPDTGLNEISGLAPRCKLLSLKVLRSGPGGNPVGNVSDLIAAIGYLQQINGYGRALKVHGLNLSLGYAFDPAWFAAGQSPLCVEVDRLVRCGVVVVVAAGNAGYGRVTTMMLTSEPAALGCTIADPGNARLAITVGSTHRDQPHIYGVSYFSAKGPTADGREKPDLVAPGERIVSCQAANINPVEGPAAPVSGDALFMEDSGTSMAAPHVSGAIAGFLSVRREYLGRPEEVKDIFVRAATDLRRRPEFQGAGLLDIMRALQSV